MILITLAALFALGCQNNDWKTTDKVEVISEAKAPDGKHVATVFSCSGGGAAGYTYTNVNLRKAAEDFNQRDFLLGKHNWNSFADIEVLWKDAKNLEVSYFDAMVYRHKGEFADPWFSALDSSDSKEFGKWRYARGFSKFHEKYYFDADGNIHSNYP